ncbi:twin-arginine translocation signal domain-containing protein [Bacteroides sp.]|uniref:twin-arginine translocation signal domain-containing protein n=1 Tax=Bacteroides sp. TaxID=29523 RepID=UPI00338E4C57
MFFHNYKICLCCKNSQILLKPLPCKGRNIVHSTPQIVLHAIPTSGIIQIPPFCIQIPLGNRQKFLTLSRNQTSQENAPRRDFLKKSLAGTLLLGTAALPQPLAAIASETTAAKAKRPQSRRVVLISPDGRSSGLPVQIKLITCLFAMKAIS